MDLYLLYVIVTLLIFPGILFGIIAQVKVNTTFKNFSAIESASGKTAGELTKEMLIKAGLHDVSMKLVDGKLTDHYHPKQKYIALSDDVYNSKSIAAHGVAMHELGHAIQHQQGYGMLKLRQLIIPLTSFASALAIPLIIIGIILGFGTAFAGPAANWCMWIGVGFYGIMTLLSIITLPVEYNASNRALSLLQAEGYDGGELVAAKKVLNAAALTYLANMIISILYFLRFALMIFMRR